MAVTGFILAGGKSTRMGRDKALLDWHGQTLLDHMIGLLAGATDQVEVVGRDRLPDRLPGLGPISGIATGLEASMTDANLFVAVDLPHLTTNLLKYLRSRLENSARPLMACKLGSDFPLTLGIWRPMLPQIKMRIDAGHLSIRGLIEASPTEIISEGELREAGFDASLFRNINTPADYSGNS